MSDTNTQTSSQTLETDRKPLMDPFLTSALLRGDFVPLAAADWGYTAIAGAFGGAGSAKFLRRTPIASILVSGGIALPVIMLRELVVSPLVLVANIGNTHLRERQSLYAIESKALLISGDDDVRNLTRDFHKANDANLLNRVGETGIAALLMSFSLLRMKPPTLTPREYFMRSTPAGLRYAAAMMVGQLAYNSISMRFAEIESYPHRSHPRTSEELGAEINEHLRTHANLDELHRKLDLEQLQDESIQVQKELAVVRRALAFNSSQK